MRGYTVDPGGTYELTLDERIQFRVGSEYTGYEDIVQGVISLLYTE
jgi:hypothetical protein